ncbi:MAG: TMEM175 family protein [Acidimicrobiales bacterium]
MPASRLEAFSDGVIAIAITLLVLEIHVPEEAAEGLAHALADQWSSYAAYLLSFVVIGIMWVNHHALMASVAKVDRALLLLNLHLLLWIAVLPFPTALVAEYIRHGDDAHVAMAVYSANMLGSAIAFNLLWLWITRDARLLHAHVDHAAAKASRRRFGVGVLVYVATVALSFANAILTLVVHFAVAAYYVADQLGTRADVER